METAIELYVVEGLIKKYLYEGKQMVTGYLSPVEGIEEAHKWRAYMQAHSITGKVVFRIRRITEEEAQTKYHGCRQIPYDQFISKRKSA